MSVELHCVSEGAKVRVRITCYIDMAGKRHEGVYHNEYNCRFPRALREDGKVFKVPEQNVKLCGGQGKAYFYTVGVKDIESVSANEISHVWTVCTECVCCMNADVSVVFAPCGHAATCGACASAIQNCCICRSKIAARVDY
jgi:hypothetical protein